jgi:hypothetical protein
MSIALYEIAEDILKLEAILEDEEIGNDESLAEALAEAMDEAQGNLSEKVSSIVGLLRNWDSTATAIKAEETRLAERRKMFTGKSDRLRGYLLTHLQRIDAPKLTLDIATVSRRQGSERVEIDDELNLPQGYYESEYVVKPDKAELKKLWKETDEAERDELPGFHVARGPESLMIK